LKFKFLNIKPDHINIYGIKFSFKNKIKSILKRQ
jgi:hypothetical protein